MVLLSTIRAAFFTDNVVLLLFTQSLQSIATFAFYCIYYEHLTRS